MQNRYLNNNNYSNNNNNSNTYYNQNTIEITSLRQENTSLKQKNITLAQELEIYREQTQDKIFVLQNNENKYLQQINEIQANYYLLMNKLDEMTKQNSLLSKEKNQLTQQYSDLNLRYNAKFVEETKYIETQKKQYEKLYEIDSLKVEKTKLTEKVQNLEEKLNQRNKFVEQKDESQYGYDMIIQMKSLYDLQNNLKENKLYQNYDQSNKENLTHGYNVQIIQKIEKSMTQNELSLEQAKYITGLKVQKYKNNFNPNLSDVIVIGFQGQRNKGKTFLLNCLIDEYFPSDFHLSTPGVCIKEHQIKNKKVVYVDSEGLGNPISMDYDNNQHYQTLIENKRKYQKVDEVSFNNLNKDITNKHYDIKATEQIQQEFIIQNSNILIIAISQVTLEDQKLIHSISEKFMVDSDKKSERKLIVVHNLKDFHRPEYVKDYMQQLKKNFSVKEQEIDTYKEQLYEDHCNIILFDEVRPHITHVVMAYKESEAGKQYNKFALYYIKQIIGLCKDLQKFDIRDKLKMYLNQNLHNFIEIKSSNSDEIQQAIQSKEMLDYCQKNEKIYLKQGYMLERLKELQVNIFGSLFRDCNYSIVKSRHNPEKELFLLVEIPGTATFVRRYDKSNGKFIIKISQNDDLEKKVGDELKLTTRKFEQKEMTIQICKEKELWTYYRDSDADLKNGVHIFVFKKEDDNTDFY